MDLATSNITYNRNKEMTFVVYDGLVWGVKRRYLRFPILQNFIFISGTQKPCSVAAVEWPNREEFFDAEDEGCLKVRFLVLHAVG